MPDWMSRFFNFIRNLPGRASRMWSWPLRKFRKLDIPESERESFARYGETVIAMQAAGSFEGNVEHARDWLTERARSRQRRENITLILEIAVALLILGEILLALWQGHLQSVNFKEQQQVLTNLQTSSAATAKTIESMNAILQMQLDAAKKSEVQAERSAKAAEASASVAALSLHTSERAYIDVDAGLTSTPKVGERLAFRAYFINVGRTPALDVVTRVRSGLVPVADTAEHAHSVAFGRSVPIPYTSKGFISAGGRDQSTWDSAAPLSQAEQDGLTTGLVRLYVFADVTYKDEFNRPHQTNFCAFLDPKTNALMHCDSLNDAK